MALLIAIVLTIGRLLLMAFRAERKISAVSGNNDETLGRCEQTTNVAHKS